MDFFDYISKKIGVKCLILPKNNFILGLPGIGLNVNNPFKLSEFLVKNNTTNKTVFKSIITNSDGKKGIESISSFSSIEGVALYPNHKYTLIQKVNNRAIHLVLLFICLSNLQR